MRATRIYLLLAICFLATSILAAPEDYFYVLTLKDGSVVEGKVVREDVTQVVLSCRNGNAANEVSAYGFQDRRDHGCFVIPPGKAFLHFGRSQLKDAAGPVAVDVA